MATDPFGTSNKQLLMTGPFSGTLLPTSSRMVLVSQSPVRGTIGLSHVGGGMAREIKFAGCDAVIREGRADEPVCVCVEDDKVDLRDAAGLWGRGVFETE